MKILNIAASRTDRGVHALGQTITFDLSSTIAERFRNDPSVIQAVINNRLPSDVCIRSIEEVSMDFNVVRLIAVSFAKSYYQHIA